MKLVTGEQMRTIDKYAIEKIGIPSIVLMENAARKVAEVCIRVLKDKVKPKAMIFAGKGNNGGDGFAVARLLYNEGIQVEVILIGNSEDIKGDAKVNYDIIKNLGINVNGVYSLIDKRLESVDIIIDAIYGTGLKGNIRQPAKDLIDTINNSGKYIVSVDIPSGISADTGEVLGCGIKANETVTFCMAKIGIIVYPGANYSGKISVVDISIPQSVINDMDIKYNTLTQSETNKMLPIRKNWSNKGSYGNLFVLGGSHEMTGAAGLVCKAGYRCGAGVVTCCTVESAVNVVQKLVAEAVEVSLKSINGKVCEESYFQIVEKLKKASSIVIGPGLGTGKNVYQFVSKTVENANVPVVIDADGLNVLSENLEPLNRMTTTAIVTPHPKEMSRLTGLSVESILSDTIGTAVLFSQKYNVITVLKDARTVIANADGRVYINMTGNNAMAKGGSGDVLSGVIGALLAQGMDGYDASVLGVYVHGLAGEIAAEDIGSYGLMAREIADYVPIALKKIQYS